MLGYEVDPTTGYGSPKVHHVQDGGCFALGVTETSPEAPVQIFTLDSEKERTKLLNTYYSFDLQALLDLRLGD